MAARVAKFANRNLESSKDEENKEQWRMHLHLRFQTEEVLGIEDSVRVAK